ncbi:MAG: N-acetylmuramoyl-L-alanine amidase [Armatimonadetes bacterium]|nr:N-acetylmuramoyl-L-alanine amidase [Armatimonadota bacterium]
MAATVALGNAPQPATIQWASAGTFSQDCVRVGDTAYITPTLAKSWGWNVSLRGDEVQIATEGRLFRTATLMDRGTRYFDLSESARMLGAYTEWDGDTFRVLARVRNIDISEKSAAIFSTINTKATSFQLKNPDRYVMDIQGAHLDESQIKNLPAWWRVGQYSKDTVRIVIEHPAAINVRGDLTKASREFTLSLPKELAIEPAKITTPIQPRIDQDPTSEQLFTTVGVPTVVSDSATETVIKIETSKALSSTPAVKYLSPTQVEIYIAGARLTDLLRGELKGSRWVNNVMTSGDNAGSFFQFDTNKPMAFEAKLSGNAIILRLFRPATSGSLVGQIIVIDAGHGGSDSGARSGGVNEKSLTLPVAIATAKAFTDAGASVILTRSQDTFPSLQDRCDIANNSGANLFISIHANSVVKANSRSGSITFYHMDMSIGKLLAECIQNEISKASNIPSLGIWSDKRIYKDSGFKVLRDTKMPAVLIEMGFVNHDFDRGVMNSKDFPAKMAQAILRGVKNFVGEGK